MPYHKIQNSYETNYYIKENFSIYNNLNCSNRHPTPQNTCFCTEAMKNSIWPQCKKYENKKNQCIEAVCCNSCDVNKQNHCAF